MNYTPNPNRYNSMEYKKCGESGLKLPAVSLGLWHNFGDNGDYQNMCKMCFTAFDNGITHFDLSNNYGPTVGKAEENFGKILNSYMKQYRDEMIISTKAGYYMWPGPYGDHGSRKYLMSSLDQSLKRLNLDYVDIFYHHRMDPDTPLYETMWDLMRVIPCCAVTGQAAGTAASMTDDFSNINIKELQEKLVANGVILHEGDI